MAHPGSALKSLGEVDSHQASDQASPPSLRRLIRQAYPERCLLIWATVCLFCSTVLNMALPALVGAIIDVITPNAGGKSQPSQEWIQVVFRWLGAGTDASSILMVASLVLLVTSSVAAIFSCVRGYWFGLAGERLVARLRIRLFERLMAAEVGFYDETRTGELVNRLATDTTTLKDTLSDLLFHFFFVFTSMNEVSDDPNDTPTQSTMVLLPFNMISCLGLLTLVMPRNNLA
jgi:ABC-type multidrug transport system fused ATPase/permease subunit